MAVVPATQFLDAVAALSPQIEAAAEENERARRLSLPLVEAMAEAGLFRLWRPRSLGGAEVDPATALRVVEAVSRIDGAPGWCLAVHGNGSLPSGYLPREGAREIFGRDPNVPVAGTWPPLGEAVSVNGGYRATGRWPFASGCQHARWLQAGCRIIDRDGPRPLPDGSPVVRVLFFPATNCEILDTWHTAGMRGTGSHDFTIKDVFVPAEHTMSFREPPVESGPLYALPTIGLSAAAIAAVSLGIARHAIDILTAVAGVKVAMRSQRVLSQHAALQADLGRAEGLLRAGRALLYQTVEEAWQIAAAGETLGVTQRVLLFLAATQAQQAATQAVDLMYGAAGSAAIYANTGLERCLRDIRTAGHHIAVAPGNYEMVGQALLGFDMSMTPLLRMDDRSAGTTAG